LGDKLASYLSIWSNGHAAASKKSEALEIILALRERAPWQVARRILERSGFEAGAGWDSAIADAKSRDDFREVNIDELYSQYISHLCCGEKSLRRFNLGHENASRLRDYLRGQFGKKRVTRPRLRNSLLKAPLGDPELVCAFARDGATCGLFSTIRSFEERVEISPDQIPQGAFPSLAAFDELIAIRRVKYEAYGVIWILDDSDEAEIRIDTHVDDTSHGLADFHQRMYAQLHGRSGSKSVLSPINLFGAIKSLYDAKQEGILAELSFATTTGSVKQERMRSHASLRQETYHVGGVQALATEIEPFRIALRWRRQNALTKEVSSPELHLGGSLLMVSSASPELSTAAILRATSFDDFDFVHAKLLEHA
jgi:hypothetical protein